MLREMLPSSALTLSPQDKLDALRYVDEFRFWRSLDDERRCGRCHQIITGRQILVFERQGTRGNLRLQCPTAGCVSKPGDWTYANLVQAAKPMAEPAVHAEKARAQAAANERTHHGERAAMTRSSIFAPAPTFRTVLTRLLLGRPIASALHALRPMS